MKPRPRSFLFAAVAIVLTISAGYLLYPRELKYHGKTISQWACEAADSKQPDSDRAKVSLAKIGTNAVPVLLNMLQARDAVFKRRLGDLLDKQRFVRITIRLADNLHRAAVTAFHALGPSASGAIPRLTRLLDGPDTAEDSLRVLTSLGDVAIPALLKAATNTSPNVRRGAIFDLGYRHQPRPEVILALLSCLKDPNAEVRSSTAYVVSRFPELTDVLVPALIAAMDDPDAHVRILAAQSLGEFGARAKLAIPRLLIEVRRDGSVSIAATALSKIDPDSADKAGIARMHPTPSYE